MLRRSRYEKRTEQIFCTRSEKWSENRSSRFGSKILLISFSRGSGPPLNSTVVPRSHSRTILLVLWLRTWMRKCQNSKDVVLTSMCPPSHDTFSDQPAGCELMHVPKDQSVIKIQSQPIFLKHMLVLFASLCIHTMTSNPLREWLRTGSFTVTPVLRTTCMRSQL